MPPATAGEERNGILGTLYRYELKMLLRDKRTIFFSVILPLILIPGMIFIMRYSERRAEERRRERTYEYAVVGAPSPEARALLDEALERPPEDSLDVRPLVLADPMDPDSALRAGDLDVVVRLLGPREARARRDSLAAEARAEAERRAAESGADTADLPGTVSDDLARAGPDVPLYLLRFRGNDEESQDGALAIAERLEALRRDRQAVAYRTAGLPVDPDVVGVVELDRIASAERESGAQLALWLTPLVVMLMLSGGSVVAADTISGEKERGTLETLLTTSARRRDIVLAKQLLIITVGIAITVINVADLAIFLGLGLFDLPEQFVISIAPTTIGLLLLLFLPLTVLISSVLLMLSGYTKSYKEYQLYFVPLTIAFLLPASAAVLPGLELASVISVIPMANVSVAVREILVGEHDWPFLALTVLTTSAVALWLARLTERSLSTEQLITAAELDEADLRGGPALFPRRVLRWFAIMWAILFLSSAWLAGDLGIRTQVVVNLVGIFLVGSLLMLRSYRLDPRRALALRAPRAAVWPAVLIGAPAAFIVGIGLAHLGQLLFPVPERLIEAFGQFMVPEDLPLWQIVFFLAVMPGICEEIAFRGLLLHGLRTRFGPIMLVVVTGAIFGFFHVELFRLIPTAYLGMVLAAVTLLTGSIFPAMLWHALNNSAALVPAALGWWAPDAAIPGWGYAVAAAGLVVSFAILWRYRTPYPGMRKSRVPVAAPQRAGRG
jgi:sodium transport system permease protein